MYYRCMDGTFVVLSNKKCDRFLHSRNSLHISRRFTFEKELTWLSFFWTCWLKNSFPNNSSPPFTGQYLRWNSLSRQERKTNLILLTYRVLFLCSSERLPSELDKIKFIPTVKLMTTGARCQVIYG